jgi:hypothetical protein
MVMDGVGPVWRRGHYQEVIAARAGADSRTGLVMGAGKAGEQAVIAAGSE